jgi:DNA ligase-1
MITLFKKNRYWTILLEGSKITKKWGRINGKESSTSYFVERGKNIGKSNETTPEQQANIMMNFCVKKQKDAGYSEKNDVVEYSLPRPMLATTWNGITDLKHAFIQPKLDGVRLLVGRFKGNIIMQSRTGKIMEFEHIRQNCEFLEEGQFLDGEMFDPNLSFEEITGIFRGPSENHSKLNYHCFDFFDLSKPDLTFNKRIELLDKFKVHQNFIMVSTSYIDIKDVDKIHKSLSENYEGTIIRDPNGIYEFDKRSKTLMKFKDFFTKEYIITAWTVGKDNTIIWICKTESGKDFNVRPTGTTEYRKKLLTDAKSHIGKFLTVKYQETTTKHKVPRFPVGLSIRDYE